MGVLPPFFVQKSGFGLWGSKFLSPTLIIYLLVKSDLVYFWLIFGILPQFFAQKSGFGLLGVKIFISNLNHLLVLAYPENLSSIGLMVEAEDTFRGAGAGASGGASARGDYTENLSLIGF